jgi:hypothetical protein
MVGEMQEWRGEGGECVGGPRPIVWTVELIDEKKTKNKIHIGLRWLLIKKLYATTYQKHV